MKLTGDEKSRLAKRSTENTEAYQLYLADATIGPSGLRTSQEGRRVLSAGHR